jgi:hypothetical protein
MGNMMMMIRSARREVLLRAYAFQYRYFPYNHYKLSRLGVSYWCGGAAGLQQSGSLDCSVWPANRFRPLVTNKKGLKATEPELGRQFLPVHTRMRNTG